MNPRPPRPAALPVLTDPIPAGMQARSQWVVWKYEFKPEKTKPWTKVPYHPKRGYAANHSNPSTWGSSDEAVHASRTGRFDGIGYVFSQSDPYCGIDLDDCRNPVDGSIVPLVQPYIDRLASYTEVSPSGTGLHIVIEGRLPGGGRKDPKQGIEVYDRERFFCFTGQMIEGTPAEPQPRQAELDWFHDEIFDPKKTQAECGFEPDTSPLTATEQKILDNALANTKGGEKMRLLFEGKYEAEYQSQSEADLALCNLLAFWFNRDPVAIDKVFRTSKLYRPKWDEKHFSNEDTYGQRTVQKALEAVLEGYRGTIPKKTQSPGFEGEPYDIFGEPALTGKPEWPANACPRAIDAFARDEAERIGVDIAMVALPAIGVAAIVATTNRNLEEEVRKGRFRQDLYYRLNVFPITVPPLRQRKDDIPLLVQAFIERYARKLGKQITSVPKKTMKTLQDYPWPGNVRELESVLERAVVLCSGPVLQLADKLEISSPSMSSTIRTLEEVERNQLLKILSETRWHIEGKDGAAAILGLHPSTLRARMHKLGILRPEAKEPD